MDVLLDEWPWLLNIHTSETVADLLYVTCFCNVYAWILIKYQLHFDFLVVFTPLLRPCQLHYHVSWLLYCCSLHSFFFVLRSGRRPLPVTTFFVFSKPLCSHFAATLQPLCSADCDSGIFCTAAKGLSTAARNSQNLLLLQPALLQLFCSASWSHSAVLQQRCSFRTGLLVEISHNEAKMRGRRETPSLLSEEGNEKWEERRERKKWGRKMEEMRIRETLSFLSFLPCRERALLAGKLLACWLAKPIATAR